MVNTFLPYPDYNESARVLDYKRLGKQRVETKQILRALRKETKGWRNHTATRMWVGYENQLVRYGIAVCCEWISRGYNDTLLEYFMSLVDEYNDGPMPPWFGLPEFHISHQSNLVRKDEEYYRVFFPEVPPNLPYCWPQEPF